MNFSQRYGYTKIRQELQEESMDSNLRNSLWNAVYKCLEHTSVCLYEEIICDFFKDTLVVKDPVFELMEEMTQKHNDIKTRFLKLEWFKVYDFIEFFINAEYFKERKSEFKILLKSIKKDINNSLEREFSAYRLVYNIIVKITDENEISAIEHALSIKNGKFKPIKIHLEASLQKLSDKKNPDYRNSIKESISAIEACCRILTGENTLGKALDKLDKNGIKLNAQLKKAFDKLYAYTNNKSSGIRHAIIEEGNEPDFEDAKYMLTSCSAFVNYLISKSK